jgi:BetI-type transcriptional repressor, C-terminal
MTGTQLEQETETPSEVQDRIVRAAVLAFRRLPFHMVDAEAVAVAAGLDLAVVARHFPTWQDLVGTTTAVWNGERLQPILPIAERSGAIAFLRSVVVANQADPALMRLLVTAATIVASPSHPVAATLQQQYLQFHATLQRTLAQDVAIGREPEGTDPASAAEQLIALYEGLQLQSMLRPSMDLVDAFDRATALLRAGWGAQVRAREAVWQI